MKPDVIFDFEKLSDSKTRYILRNHAGNDVHNFPSVWIADNHPHKGEKYIIFTGYWGKQPCPTTCAYTHELSFGRNRLENDKERIGLNFFPDFLCRTYGVFMNDTLLIQLSEDWNKMTVYYFKDKREMAHFLFKEWTSEKLRMTLEEDVLAIPA